MSATSPTIGPIATLPATIGGCCAVTTSIWALTGQPMPVRAARQVLADQIGDHVTDPAVMDDLYLMVSEAATNAAVHAAGPCELRIIAHDGIPLVVEIADTGDQLATVTDHLKARPDPDDLEALAIDGRGLGIIARLSSGRCGVHPTRLTSPPRIGKAVWFAIPGP